MSKGILNTKHMGKKAALNPTVGKNVDGRKRLRRTVSKVRRQELRSIVMAEQWEIAERA